MASALVSPPPLFSGGSSDLKANARKFLERALLISALVHLAAVGVFRAALERFAATEAEIPAPHKHWFPPTIFMPPLLPIPKHWTPPTGSSEKGVLVPRDKEVIFDTIDRGPGRTEFDPVRNPSPGGPDDPNPGPRIPEPPRPAPVFTYADTPPVPIVAPRPAYPTWAREAGIEGKVLVRVLVGTDGIPRKAVIIAGPRGLTDGVVDAVLRWKFKPGLTNKVPVEVWVEIPISFRLGE